MKYQLLLAAVIVITSEASATVTGTGCNPIANQDLITNGGFEVTKLKPNEFFRHTNNISAWAVYGGADGELQKQGHSGEQKVELASTHGYKLAQHIDVQPGHKYLLRFWGKYRKPQYNKLNILLKDYPNGACNTPNNFTIPLNAKWEEYGYILCPNTNRITLEFSQQRDTGGGYGLHLDDVSMAPCREEAAQLPDPTGIFICPLNDHYTVASWGNSTRKYYYWNKPYGDPQAVPKEITKRQYHLSCPPDPRRTINTPDSGNNARGLKESFGNVRHINKQDPLFNSVSQRIRKRTLSEISSSAHDKTYK